MQTVSFDAAPETEDALRRFLADQALPAIFDQPGVVGVHFGMADRSGSEIVTAERKARGNFTRVPGWVVLLEAMSVSAAMDAGRELAALETRGVEGPIEKATYRLECSLVHARSIG